MIDFTLYPADDLLWLGGRKPEFLLMPAGAAGERKDQMP
jgi:hypothetical protein